MSYQTPTTLAAVRDGTLTTYSMSDARFTRGDNNASPVPSTLSQQTTALTSGHQAQPMLAQTAAGPYFFTPYNPMQASYPFSAVYPVSFFFVAKIFYYANIYYSNCRLQQTPTVPATITSIRNRQIMVRVMVPVTKR